MTDERLPGNQYTKRFKMAQYTELSKYTPFSHATQNLIIPIIRSIWEKQKKSDNKTGIFTQNQFLTESIFLYGCNSKTNH